MAGDRWMKRFVEGEDRGQMVRLYFFFFFPSLQYDWIQKTQQGVFYFVGTSASDPEKRLRRPTNNDVEDDYEYRE